jgi:hypothetical protein
MDLCQCWSEAAAMMIKNNFDLRYIPSIFFVLCLWFTLAGAELLFLAQFLLFLYPENLLDEYYNSVNYRQRQQILVYNRFFICFIFHICNS